MIIKQGTIILVPRTSWSSEFWDEYMFEGIRLSPEKGWLIILRDIRDSWPRTNEDIKEIPINSDFKIKEE